jgi:hypothetical protein
VRFSGNSGMSCLFPAYLMDHRCWRLSVRRSVRQISDFASYMGNPAADAHLGPQLSFLLIVSESAPRTHAFSEGPVHYRSRRTTRPLAPLSSVRVQPAKRRTASQAPGKQPAPNLIAIRKRATTNSRTYCRTAPGTSIRSDTPEIAQGGFLHGFAIWEN